MADNIVHNSSNQPSESPFDSIRHQDVDGEFWLARELTEILGYPRWADAEDMIDRAKTSCQNAGNSLVENFSGISLKTSGRPKQDYRLSRFACYLIAQNGDPRKPEIAAAQAYFAIKTREAEIVEIQQPVVRELPTRDIVDYVQAANMVEQLPEGMLKQLLKNGLIDEVSLQQNLKYLPVAEKPKQYTIAKVRAKMLGYTDAQIKNGSALGKFLKTQIEPAFTDQIGNYPVNHYEICDRLDKAIHLFFH